MIEILKKLIDTLLHNQNQFASGGLLLMAIGSIGALFRSVPNDIWKWVVHQTTISLIVTDENNEFDWLRAWLEEQSLVKKARHIDIGTGNRRTWWRPSLSKTLIAPAPGHHWMIYRNRPLSIRVSRLDDTKSGERKESIEFKTLGRDQKFFRGLIKDVIDRKDKETPKPKLHIWNTEVWREINPYLPRPLDTIIFSNGLKKELVQDIEDFKNSQNWYAEMGIPYHRGYLFEGPAGTGKTSLIVGLSHYFNAKVYILRISDMTDSILRKAVSSVDSNSFIVMEDVDCIAAAAARKPTEEEKQKDEGVQAIFSVTQSGLLNVLDGLLAPNGVLFFLTTNHLEKLDPALIRPGRIDVQKHIGIADSQQKIEMFKRFFPKEIIPQEYLEKSLTMADLQQILMAKRQAS